MARLNFDARGVAPDSGSPDPVPAGWYNVAIRESDMKPTTDGTGAYLATTSEILDGQYKGRKVFARFNLRNNSEKAVKIAYGQLSALCHAVGVLLCEDSAALHNIPHKIKVSLRPGSEKKDKVTGQPTGEFYEASNDVKQWKNINEPVDMSPAPAAVTHAGPVPGAVASAPAAWAPPVQPQAPQQPQGAPAWAGAPAGGAAPWAGQPAPAAAPAAPPQAAPWAGAPAAPPAAAPAGMAPPWAGAPGGAPVAPPAAAAPPMAPPWAAGGAPQAPPWAPPGQ